MKCCLIACAVAMVVAGGCLPSATKTACVAAGVHNVRAYGAKGDGVTKDTTAVQAAIDAASRAVGGEVVLPAGRYICGTLYLKSNVDVNLALGATIEGSKDPADYNAWNFCPQEEYEKRCDEIETFKRMLY